MNRTGTIGLALTALSVIGLVVSIPVMARKLSTREDLRNRPIVWFQAPIVDESFYINGIPISVEVVDDSAAAGGRAIRVHWRGDAIDIPVLLNDDPRKPGLARFEEWFAILPMFQGRGSRSADVIEQLEAGEVVPRVIIAARLPASGLDPETWGSVQRQNYRYRFIELHENTPPDHTHDVTERTYRELEAIYAPGPHSPEIEVADAEREANYWQHDAMLQVTPAALYRARSKVVQVAMRSMGWTWPVACAGVLGLVAGLVLLGASRVSGEADGP